MKTKRRLLIVGIVIGSLLTLAPLLGLLGTAFGMHRAFDALDGSGIGNPKAVSAGIGIALFASAAGIFLLPIGIIILVVSLVFFFRLRASIPPQLPQLPTQ